MECAIVHSRLGAALALEARTDEYITTFLGYEYATRTKDAPDELTKRMCGYIETDRRPGYRYVDVIDSKDGQRYLYTGRWDEPWQYDKSYLKGYIKFFLDRVPAPDPAPRYGVTFEDHVIPEDRVLGVASSTVKVINLEADEVLGEMLRYAWSTPASRANPSPWLTAHRCPEHGVGTGSATRKFVDQILIPRKEQ